MLLIKKQPHLNKDIYTHKNIPFLPTGSTVAVQEEDDGLWKHGTIVGYEIENHNGRSYKIRVTMAQCTMTRTKRHVKTTLISAEDYLRKWDFRRQSTKDR